MHDCTYNSHPARSNCGLRRRACSLCVDGRCWWATCVVAFLARSVAPSAGYRHTGYRHGALALWFAAGSRLWLALGVLFGWPADSFISETRPSVQYTKR